MGPTNELKIQITADGHKAKAEIQGVDKVIDKLAGGSAVKLQKGFQGAASAASNLAGIFTGNRLSGATSQFTSLAGALDAIPGAAGLAAGGIAALVAAGTGGAVALFNLTKAASEFGSSLYDAHIQTGLSAASISALKLAADSSGSSLEAISGSVAKFNVLLGQAAQGNEKAQTTLTQYGITAKTTDDALNQAVATIGKMATADQKAAAAKDLFKDRTGAILPVVDQVNGDLEDYIKTAEKLGQTLTEEDLRAADAFGDQLGVLGQQAKIAGFQFASELMPMMTQAMATISQAMSDNKGVARDWGQYLVDTCSGVANAFRVVEAAGELSLGQLGIRFRQNADEAETWADKTIYWIRRVVLAWTTFGLTEAHQLATGGVSPNTPSTIGDTSVIVPRIGGGGGPGGGGGRGTGRVKKDNTVDDALRKWEKEERERIAGLQKDYREATDLFAAERAKMLAIAEQYADAYNKTEDDMARHAEMLATQVLNNKKEELQKYMDEVGQGVEEYAKAQHEMALLDLEIETQKAKFAKNEQERQKKALEDEEKLRKERRKSWSEYVKFIQEINDSADAEADRQAKERQLIKRQQAEKGSVMGGGGYGAGIAGGLGVTLPSIWDDTTNQIKTQAQVIKDTYADVADFAGNAIGSMVDGLVQLGVQWLMTGEFSARAALQMLAASALHIATEAAFKGIFELAEAAAAAARWDFVSAALHKAASGIYFKTAAIAGAVGVGAAVVGRFVGGGEGSGRGSGGGYGSSGGYGGGRSGQTQPEAFSRTSPDAFISGRRGGPYNQVLRDIATVLSKFESARPGDVLMRGMGERPGAVANQVGNDIARNAGLGRRILSKSGVT